MYKIISKRKFYYAFSLALVIASVVFLSMWGLKSGIDFTGGSLMQVSFQNTSRPSVEDISSVLKELDYMADTTVQPVGDNEFIFRFKDVTEEQHQEILNKLKNKYVVTDATTVDSAKDSQPKIEVVTESNKEIGNVNIEAVPVGVSDQASLQEEKFESVGPTIGQELKTKSFYAIILVIIAIIAYIAWSFRKVGRPVQSWKYGITAVIALVHDVTITCGVFALLGHFYGVEVNTPFIAAVLTVLGYSVNDTIVVFDRIRENLHRYQGDFEETVNISVNQTAVRSINTSMTVMFTLLAIFFFGGASIKFFALALIFGVFFGTYSSIFVASSLLVTWQNLIKKFSK
ncbi:MAG: protein translocase subunit SecF [Patescibacteria group bacterium]|jgi:preprotein translocase subunit SecF